MVKIQCRPVRKLYPPAKEDEVGFMVCLYRAVDAAELPAFAENAEFAASGPLLPYCSKSTVTLIGEAWETGKDGKPSLSNVSSWTESVDAGKTCAYTYLLNLNGCEQGEANRILNKTCSENPLHEIDEDPAIITRSVSNKSTAERITKAFLLRRAKKEIFFYLLPFCGKKKATIAAEAAVAAKSLTHIRTDPFQLAVTRALPYTVAAKIAKANNIKCDSGTAIEAAVVEALLQSEGASMAYATAGDDSSNVSGNTYLTVEETKKKVGDMLALSKDDVNIVYAINRLLESGVCMCAKGKYLYRTPTCLAEYGTCDELARIMSADIEEVDYSREIECLENKKKMRLAPEQRAAVNVALSNAFSLLIGGPGCGKTTIEQFIIEIYRRHHKEEKVLLVAPTGKAARRMSDATNEPACTIHKALGVSAGVEVLESNVSLDAGLIIVDECSMIDLQVMFALSKAIKTGTQVLLVGDTNQLPSVGAGNVLSELISSGVIPIAKLETVYRQKAGSTIAANCARIKRGYTTLETSDTFIFREASSQEEAVQKIIEAYKDELNAGLTNNDIYLLSPYRNSTPTGVNQINPVLQRIANDISGESIKYGNKVFYVGDKVMVSANRGEVANGDIGFVTAIRANKGITVDFKDGRVLDFTKSDLRDFELAFGITIHKSQGSEAKTCIIVLMDEHKAMLKRNLIYTAVSRAKNKVIIIGTKAALDASILTEDATKRQSRLGEILRDTIKALS